MGDAMRRHHRLAAAAAGLALLTGAVAAVPASASAGAAPAASGTTAVKATNATKATTRITNARTATHCTYDRLVIDAKGALPPTTVKRVTRLRYDGSGRKVPLAGTYFVEIKLSPAAAHNAAGGNTYKGPRLTALRLPKLKGLALTGDFEGVVTFGTSFTSKPSWTTKRLHGPERFVVDFGHADTCR
ncbi:hypothetical protein ACIP98_07545 [Streptomyces sp. NPDC088354]|uniref:AMIN-like domain-containing (lipo)protein n=1 Tax=Streptomyces sp. NPDC088354 TaxID=3365856 RepID=UPI0038026C07